MAKFIEINDKDEGKFLINTEKIQYVYKEKDGSALITFEEVIHFSTKESYEEIKAMLG